MNVYTKTKLFLSSIAVLATLTAFAAPLARAADKLQSPQYQIQLNDMSVDQSNQISGTADEGISLLEGSEKAAFAQKGASVKSINSDIGLKVSLSDMTVSYDLSSSLAQTTLVSISFSTDVDITYMISVAEDHSLKHNSGNVIPNTSCNPKNRCNSTYMGVWSENTPGFGFTLDGTNFRPFADLSQNEKPKVILSNTNFLKSREATMTFKLIKPQNTSEGTYQNNVYIITSPNY